MKQSLLSIKWHIDSMLNILFLISAFSFSLNCGAGAVGEEETQVLNLDDVYREFSSDKKMEVVPISEKQWKELNRNIYKNVGCANYSKVCLISNKFLYRLSRTFNTLQNELGDGL